LPRFFFKKAGGVRGEAPKNFVKKVFPEKILLKKFSPKKKIFVL